MVSVYKIKLHSGRVLGPLDLDRVRALILAGHIRGDETGRDYPKGEWQEIARLPEIAELVLLHAQGKLTALSPSSNEEPSALQGSDQTVELVNPETVPSGDPTPPKESRRERSNDSAPPEAFPEERTEVAEVGAEIRTMGREVDPEGTAIDLRPDHEKFPEPTANSDTHLELEDARTSSTVYRSEQPTVMLTRADGSTGGSKKAISIKKKIVSGLAVGLMGLLLVSELLFPDKETPDGPPAVLEVKPRLPKYREGAPDPAESLKLYQAAMALYVKDTLPDYLAASEMLQKALTYDADNLRASAMLASCYINLIETSERNDVFFSVISKLIDTARAKSLDLTETVIADVEFFVMLNKAEAAQNRIVEYTKTHTTFGAELFYYLAYSFQARGDLRSATRFIRQIPDDKAFSPKVFYLRGLIAEKLGELNPALADYGRAIQMNPQHGRARLRIAVLANKVGSLKEAAPHIKFLLKNPTQLSQQELAQAYYLSSLLEQLDQKLDRGLAAIEKAHQLDPDNYDFRLEYYTLRARAGDKIDKLRQEAQMYLFLSEGERLEKEGRGQDALTRYLEARRVSLTSPIPLIKIGDYFLRRGDLPNARENYKIATTRSPKQVRVWSKYISTLIQTYEWDDALKALENVRKLNVAHASLDKLAGDLYSKQNRHTEAQMYYKRALRRDTIDSDVYIAYARSLIATKNYAEAPFFFALALRFDPLNMEAISGNAKAIAGSESIDRGIVYLQDELQKGLAPRAEILAAIAELYLQKGDAEVAQQFISDAIRTNPELALPWKLQGQIYLAQEGREKGVYEKALAAFKSYSDRNRSDPTGYMERYRMFLKRNDFEKADEELKEVYSLYPKFPYLHYYKGFLYSAMGNYKVAIEEYKEELKNNPSAVIARVQMGKDLIELGDFVEAQKALTEAMRLAPTASEPKHWAGYAAYLQKNYQAAVALYQSAVALDTGNPILYKKIGQAYLALGDRASARQSFKRYLEMDPGAKDRAEIEKFM